MSNQTEWRKLIIDLQNKGIGPLEVRRFLSRSVSLQTVHGWFKGNTPSAAAIGAMKTLLRLHASDFYHMGEMADAEEEIWHA